MHLVAALAGEVEGDAGDALDLVRGVDGGVDGALLAVLQRHDLLGLAEVGAAGQLAQDENVEAFHVLATQRGGLGQRRIADGGAQVGEQVEVLAQLEQAGLGPDLVGHLVPLRAADGAEDDGIRASALASVSPSRGTPNLSMEAPPTSAVSVLNCDLALLVEEGHDPLDLGHHLGADAVTRQEQKRMCGHGRPQRAESVAGA